MSRIAAVLVLAALLVPNAIPANARAQRRTHAFAHFYSVSDPGVSGVVHLKQTKQGGAVGTDIQVDAQGLQPGGHYLSISYSNPFCQLESDSLQNDVVGRYDANADGVGTTSGRSSDPLRKIRSVSVRLDDGSDAPPLVACAAR